MGTGMGHQRENRHEMNRTDELRRTATPRFGLVRLAARKTRAAAMALAAVAAFHGGTASASPAIDGVRNLSLADAARSSSYGTNALIINPSNMSFSRTFAVEPTYQVNIQERTHGLGMMVMDSLNNARIGLGLGYAFMKGSPRIEYTTTGGEERDLELSRFGHEVFLGLSVAVVKNWFALGVKPKYQYMSLRYRDDVGVAHNAQRRLNTFGLDVSATVNLAGWAALSVIGTNVTGWHGTPWSSERHINLPGLDVAPDSIDYGYLQPLSGYPLGLAHGLAVFPLHHPNFSLNFDGVYDFTSYRHVKHVRMSYSGSAEYVAGPVPIRLGVRWDGRGKEKTDDRIYISGGIAYVKQPKVGGVGVDVGFGFRQQVSGPLKDTVLGVNIGLRVHPDF